MNVCVYQIELQLQNIRKFSYYHNYDLYLTFAEVHLQPHGRKRGPDCKNCTFIYSFWEEDPLVLGTMHIKDVLTAVWSKVQELHAASRGLTRVEREQNQTSHRRRKYAKFWWENFMSLMVKAWELAVAGLSWLPNQFMKTRPYENISY